MYKEIPKDEWVLLERTMVLLYRMLSESWLNWVNVLLVE